MTDQATVRDAALREHLYYFVWKTFGTLHPGQQFIDAWHIEAMCYHLERVGSGEVKRLLITIPPRHLKSICVSVAFVAWLFGRSPALRVLVASYGQDLASKHARDFRAVIASEWYQHLFPAVRVHPKRNTEAEIMTTRMGSRRAVSLGGAVTGLGADMLIVDDLMKAADAHSDVERTRVKEFYEQTLFSRLNDKQTGQIIAIQQRLHEDDLAGYLIDKGNFVHLNLQAIAEQDERFYLAHGRVMHRWKGEPLFPQREPLETLEEIRREIGAFAFSAQYQQDPVPPEGNRLRWEWFGTYDRRPDRTELQMAVQSWDTAVTAEPTSDFSVCTTWGYREGNWLLLDVLRERLEYPALRRQVIDLARQWRADKVIIEYANSGIPLVRELRDVEEISVLGYRPRLDKEVRFGAQGAKLETGRFLLPATAPWLPAFKRELLGFPNARYDDQADSLSQFLEWVGSRRGDAWQFHKVNGRRRRRSAHRRADANGRRMEQA
jgi:predicted phage terminase large subunit-like protein